MSAELKGSQGAIPLDLPTSGIGRDPANLLTGLQGSQFSAAESPGDAAERAEEKSEVRDAALGNDRGGTGLNRHHLRIDIHHLHSHASLVNPNANAGSVIQLPCALHPSIAFIISRHVYPYR